MKRRSLRLRVVGALLALGLAQCATPSAPVQPVQPVRQQGSGQVYGKVALDGDRPLSGPVVVAVGGRRVTADALGNYKVDGLPGGRHAVVAELKTEAVRYLALPFAVVDEQQAQRLDIVLKDAADVDLFCSDCHPFLGKQTRSNQIIRDTHPSGLKPRKAKRTTQLLDAQGLATCESCHSLHQETGVEHFMRYPYRNGDLCNRCH